jgi:amino acid adenylation domain-containing protein
MNRVQIVQTSLDRMRGTTYVEIGVAWGRCFSRIRAPVKIAVDPRIRIGYFRRRRTARRADRVHYLEMTSDRFFETASQWLGDAGVSVVLVDGLHSFEQAVKDIENGLKHLQEDGVIVVHDCNPTTTVMAEPAPSHEAFVRRHRPWLYPLVPPPLFWTGDVWKAIALLRATRRDIRVAVLDCDYGVGVIRKGQPETMILNRTPDQIKAMTYEDLKADRRNLLNLKDPGYLEAFLAPTDGKGFLFRKKRCDSGESCRSAPMCGPGLSEGAARGIGEPPLAAGASWLTLLLNRVRRCPEQAALRQGSRAITYNELWRASGALAARLAEAGVGREAAIGVAMPRSVEAIVAMIGTMRAGCVYVPLDPDYPAERLAQMAEDARLERVIGGATPPTIPGNVRVLAYEALVANRASDHDIGILADPGSAAYVIFTSGSTGRPKGVVVEHRSLALLVGTLRDVYGLRENDRVLQFHSLSFDTSIEEICVTLAAGATLVLRDSRSIDSYDSFVTSCVADGVTVLQLPTAFWSGLTSSLDPAQSTALARHVRLAVVGGENMAVAHARRWRSLFGDRIRLINAYGPTEATVTATVCEVTDALLSTLPDGCPGVPIGRPLPYQRTIVLDERGHPAPDGMPGELCLGGPGLARGYLGSIDPTAQRFAPDPFGEGTGGRMYRTGDRVLRLPDGNLIFEGRADRQVKIAGYRIEPGEVEAVLTGLPGVVQAAVVAPSTAAGTRLHAYVTRVPGAPALDPGSLRSSAERLLPRHMVPSEITVLDRLPLTPAGKVDLKALESAASAVRRDACPGPEDATVLGRLIRRIENLLGHGGVAAQMSLTSLGLDSLHLLMLAAAVKREFGVDCSIADLLDTGSIAELAGRLESGGLVAPLPPLPEIRASGWPEKAPALLAHLRRFLWLEAPLKALGVESEVNVVAVDLAFQGPLDGAVLQEALRDLATRHETLRLALPPPSRRLSCAISRWVMRRILLSHRLSRLAASAYARKRAAQVQAAGSPDSARAFEALQFLKPDQFLLQQRPMASATASHPGRRDGVMRAWRREQSLGGDGFAWAAALWRIDARNHLLSLVLHHAIIDGASVPILIRDLLELYRARLAGDPPRLMPLPIAYSDLVLWEDRNDALLQTRSRDYLRDCYNRGGGLARLSFWNPSPPSLSYPMHEHILRRPIDPGIYRAVRSLAEVERTTPFVILLSALFMAMRRHADEDALTITGALANRDLPEVDNLIGDIGKLARWNIALRPESVLQEAIGRVRPVVLMSLRHQSHSRLQQAQLESSAILGGSEFRPFFDYPVVFFDLWPQAMEGKVAPCLSVRELQHGPRDAQGHLVVRGVDIGGGGMEIWFQYSRDRWREAGVERFADDYLEILNRSAAAPRHSVDQGGIVHVHGAP